MHAADILTSVEAPLVLADCLHSCPQNSWISQDYTIFNTPFLCGDTGTCFSLHSCFDGAERVTFIHFLGSRLHESGAAMRRIARVGSVPSSE